MDRLASRLSFLPAALLALALTAAAPAAVAAPVAGTFEVQPDSGPLAGSTLHGSFAFDDAAGAPGPLPGETVYALTAFEFDLLGTVYGLADLAYGDAVFAGSSFLGIDAAVAGLFSLLPASIGGEAFFAYAIPGVGSGNGDVGVSLEPAGVPEPAAVWLALAALLALPGVHAVGRRRL